MHVHIAIWQTSLLYGYKQWYIITAYKNCYTYASDDIIHRNKKKYAQII